MRRLVFLSILGMLPISGCAGRSTVDLQRKPEPVEPPAIVLAEDPEDRPPVPSEWARALTPVRFFNNRTGAEGTLRLYQDDGSLDEHAAAGIDVVLAERDAAARPLDRRLYQLVVKAAAHFGVRDVHVVSSFRDNARKGSRHRDGEALDFSLAAVPAAKLAAYLRKGARVGVGVYTHKRTQYVHLDVRDESYHWADGSPPGHWWRESRMTDRGAPARDAAYEPSQDLPLASNELVR